MAAASQKLEVHEHCFVTGPRANKSWLYKLSHSHEGGDGPHAHPDTGPACYTIDKDDWLRTTGLRGGGRKKFTAKPSGEQLPVIPRTAEQNSFEVIVGTPPADFKGTGGGMEAATRMVLEFGMTPIVKSTDAA